MPFCTGQGQPGVEGGCCHLGDGTVCPHYRSAADLPAWIEQSGYKGAAKSRLAFQAIGVLHACTIAMRVIADDARTVDDRALFEQRWTEHPDYVRDLRPHWDAHEDRMGLPRGAYNCATWRGFYDAREEGVVPADTVLACCYGQDQATCDTQAANLHSTAVTVRRAGGF